MSTSTALRGMTWDHPRGYLALDALAARPSGPAVVWHRQPLAGFEARPLRELARDHDLIVIDHPGLGESLQDNALLPLDGLFDQQTLDGWRSEIVGHSFDSYRLAGHQWAIPIDVAAQVGVLSAGILDTHGAPDDWEAARVLAGQVPTALCLGGPHALLMFQAVCASLGGGPQRSPAFDDDAPWLDREIAGEAWQTMGLLLAVADRELSLGDPITVLDAMAAGRVAYCPLVYGYLSYQSAGDGTALRAVDAPSGPNGRRGSVLGGTGVAVSAHCADTDTAAAVIRDLLAPEVQGAFFAEHGGQGATQACWADPAVDAAAHGFYSGTRTTMDQAWVRPRFAGYIPFQRDGSEIIRVGLLAGESPDTLLDKLYRRYESAGATT